MSVVKFSAKKDSNKALKEHFKVKEFKCKDGTDEILIDLNLVEMLEKIRKKLNCTKLVISSGYRTEKHDKAVGGSGKGQHTKGKAADIVCYNENGKISAKDVCCAAESCGARGIGYIDTYSTHIDTRSGIWFGDETKGNKSIKTINGSTSFYDYFDIKKPNKCPFKQPNRNIKSGSIGEDVKWLQWMLCSLSYNCGKVDGICGKNTTKQIKAFQQDKGLKVDGVCGKLTIAALIKG